MTNNTSLNGNICKMGKTTIFGSFTNGSFHSALLRCMLACVVFPVSIVRFVSSKLHGICQIMKRLILMTKNNNIYIIMNGARLNAEDSILMGFCTVFNVANIIPLWHIHSHTITGKLMNTMWLNGNHRLMLSRQMILLIRCNFIATLIKIHRHGHFK